MKFRPCIDIHNGKVKQIVGGTLLDQGDTAKENFVSDLTGKDYGALYKKYDLVGGHIILLNPASSEYYQRDLEEAKAAMAEFPGGLQIGGGIQASNAQEMLALGASHIIVTSYVFVDGEVRFDRLEQLVNLVGKEHIVLDLSCRKKDNLYYIVTDRWQKFTNQPINKEIFHRLSAFCDEFLVHAVDVEGTCSGVDGELIDLLADCNENTITYAGGIHHMEDLELLKTRGKDKIDFTIGSALDLFGGTMKFQEIVTKY